MIMKYLVALDPNVYATKAAAEAAIDAAGATIINNYAFNLTFEIEATTEQFDSLAGVLMSEEAHNTVSAKLQIVQNIDHLFYTTGTPEDPQPWIPLNIGAGEHVYLVDTGIRASHEQFAEATINNLHSRYENDPSVPLYDDVAGHGTAVGSMIAGTTQGASRAVTLHNIKLFNANDGEVTVGEIISALNAILYHHNANLLSKTKVVCLPWVIPQNNFVDAKIRELDDNNLVVVCAAGNNGQDVNNYSPAGVDTVITVGAYDRNYNVGSFTNTPWGGTGNTGYNNYGAQLDIFALGVDVSIATNGGDRTYGVATGTSLAAGLTAGIAAQYTSRYPSKTSKQIKDTLIQEGSFLGMNKLVFDPTAPVDYTQVSRSILTTDNVDTKQLATVPSGRLMNVQAGTSVTESIGLNPAATDVNTLDFAPCPPWITFDATTGNVTVDSTALSGVQVPGVFVFAVRGKVDNTVLVEEYSIGLYNTAESELETADQYYYDADQNDYDLVVSYQVAPYSGGVKP